MGNRREPMSNFKTLNDADVKGKRVLLRVDLNVPTENGQVTDATRIERIAPTITEIAGQGRQSHPARAFRTAEGTGPEGLAPADRGGGVAHRQAAGRLRRGLHRREGRGRGRCHEAGDILLLENTRFHKGEEKNDPAFVAELAKLGDLWVNDAFSAAHRAHASTEGLGPQAPGLCRPHHAGRAGGAGESAGRTEEARHRHRRRRQGLDQA